MKKEMFLLSFLTAGFIAMPAFAAKAGCCSDMATMPACPAMSSHETQPAQSSADAEKLPQPVATVFDNYARIQTALTQDSLQDVAKEAQAIAKAVNEDAMTTFSTNIVQQAGDLAKAGDLPGAREAFKALSLSLIEYVSKYPALAGFYRQVHCSMADADWLQKESTVNNPYFGKSMARCGQFVKSSGGGERGHQDHSMQGMKM